MSTAKATLFQSDFSLQFTDAALIREALCASGVRSRDGNKNLAQIGDTGLQFALQVEGRQRGAGRERINNITSQVAGNAALARRGYALGLEKYIENNPSQGRYVPEKLMAATMEAIVGAYFEDQGWDFEALKRVLAVLRLGWPKGEEE
ncbi:ribonuclease III domain-containing protein [Aspergillus crustosus]